jgi:hypothetical protein
MEEYNRLDYAVEQVREARLAHVRKVISIGYGSGPLEWPPEVLDAAWLTEYRRLREAEDHWFESSVAYQAFGRLQVKRHVPIRHACRARRQPAGPPKRPCLGCFAPPLALKPPST